MQYNVLAPLDTSVFVLFLVPSLQNQHDYCIHVTFTHSLLRYQVYMVKVGNDAGTVT